MKSAREEATPCSKGPDFVGVGVQKSATTWLARILDQHPEILFSADKEINFFTRNFYKGYDWYHRYFEGKEDRVAGEISVNYMYSPRPDPSHLEFYPKWNPMRTLQFWRPLPPARDELKVHYPDLKVFALFRNPVERAWSHYWYWRNRKERLGKRTVPFEEIFLADGRWMQLQGNYADHFAYWREAYPDMAAFFYDDINDNPKELIRQVYGFIGVDESFEPEIDMRVNEGSYKPIPAETRTLLIEVYRDQICRFSDMTGRDLSSWLE